MRPIQARGIIVKYIDKGLKRNRPDITVVHKDTQELTIIDNAVPADQDILLTTWDEKVERYQDLDLEIKRIHRGTRVTVIPILNDALGTISGNAKAWYGRLSLPHIFGSAQLSAILGTAHILRKVLSLSSRIAECPQKQLERITP